MLELLGIPPAAVKMLAAQLGLDLGEDKPLNDLELAKQLAHFTELAKREGGEARMMATEIQGQEVLFLVAIAPRKVITGES